MILPLQSIDFVQMFQTVIIFRLPLKSAALMLYLSEDWCTRLCE